MGDFFKVAEIKSSRRNRICEECGHPIPKGQPYRSYAQSFDGDFFTGATHGSCTDWANRVMCMDDGRGFLRDGDPSDEYELKEAVLAHPPSAEVRARLPAAWLNAVEEIEAEAADQAAEVRS
jgi:hypothetical protein